MDNCTIGLIQVGDQGTTQAQIDWIDKQLLELSCLQNKPQLVVLPEESLTLHLSSSEKLNLTEKMGSGPLQDKLSELSKKYQIYLVAGTLPIVSPDPKKYYATTIVFSPTGEQVGAYRKIHLFDVDVSEGESYRESDNIMPGDQIITLDLPFGRVGLAICYDLRFPELFRELAKRKVDIMILPSAFTIRTGQKHWETLVRARAIENLCYFIACNHVGTRKNGQGTYGHSMIVGPWGDVLAHLTNNPGILVQTLDITHLQTLRQKFPALSHRRL